VLLAVGYALVKGWAVESATTEEAPATEAPPDAARNA
jgi:hypothetical protein